MALVASRLLVGRVQKLVLCGNVLRTTILCEVRIISHTSLNQNLLLFVSGVRRCEKLLLIERWHACVPLNFIGSFHFYVSVVSI